MSLLHLVVFLLLIYPSASVLPSASTTASPFPLSTQSRWIVDSGGRRVKLACANWAAHLEPVVAEGIGKQPLDVISKAVAAMGLNCVRLTWPLYLLTHPDLGNLTVEESLSRLGLQESAAGVRVNNPELLGLTLVQAFQAVVSNLASNNLMVILDNQISKPGWCCSRYDGNGFFGDQYFDPDEWLKGLTMMATMFNNSMNVVGMSLRNELRGPRQNVSLWYRYMQRGAEAVHAANPNVLIILSGLDYDKDLSFLFDKPVNLSFTRKLVFEFHWYGFSDGGDWEDGNQNDVCGSVVSDFMTRGGFLLEQGWPLFLSEFGLDQSGTHVADNRFLSCFLSVAAEQDLDWALWALQGSYFIRDGQFSYDESYGLLGWDWCKVRNPSFVQRISALQSPFQGPGLSNDSPYNVIFHPLTGLCVIMKLQHKLLELGSCAETEAWNYTAEHKVMLKGAEVCLQATDVGEGANLGTSCSDLNSIWEQISNSSMHLSTKLPNSGTVVCLDVGPDGTIITNLCKCLSQDGTCSPDSQWFKIIKSNREIVSQDSHLKLFSEGEWLTQIFSRQREERTFLP